MKEREMEPQRIIEIYVEEVVSHVPRRQRKDIAAELRTLISDGLNAKVAAAGRACDEAMTVDFLRSFGRPIEVAARYHEPPTIIDPADSRDFLIAAAIGVAVLWQTTLILSWLGAMVLFFGLRTWLRRRRPTSSPWNPGDPDRVSRIRLLARVVVIGLGILCLAAPHWVYAELSGGGLLPARLTYEPEFYRERLPWLLAVAILVALLCLVVSSQGSWRPITRYIDTALTTATVGVLIWFRNDGSIFRSPVVDRTMKFGIEWAIFLLMIALVIKAIRMPRYRIWRRLT
jgi:hypothetical protein